MISDAQVKAGIAATLSMEAGLAKLLGAVEEIVADTKPTLAGVERRERGGLHTLSKIMATSLKVQRTQAKYLRLVLGGYEDLPADGPVVVDPIAADVPSNEAPIPVEDEAKFDPSNPLGNLLKALNPTRPHIPAAEEETF